jgi:hypothetical protein
MGGGSRTLRRCIATPLGKTIFILASKEFEFKQNRDTENGDGSNPVRRRDR